MSATASIPSHVPPELVVDFDYMQPAGLSETVDIHDVYKRLHDGPDITWSQRHGGHWIVSRYEDVRWVQKTHEIFSEEIFTIPRELTRARMPPVTVDPPEHARYRALLNPYFVPSKIKTITEDARQLTRDLIAGFKAKGTCEFVNDFARVMPVTMFLRLVDLPLDKRAEFVEWGMGYARAADMETKERYLQYVATYLTEVLNEREKNPGPDMLSRIASWRSNPRFRGEDEVIGMALIMFYAGLDSVAAMLSFAAKHLAENPAIRRRIIDDPAVIPRAVEEYIRRFSLSCSARIVRKDTDYKGVTFRKDEMMLVATPAAAVDARAYKDPMAVDFDRTELMDANGYPLHISFSNGPHTCVGAPLARAEMRVFLEEWLREIPDFALDPARPPITYGGNVVGVGHLNLVWKP